MWRTVGTTTEPKRGSMGVSSRNGTPFLIRYERILPVYSECGLPQSV